MDRWEFFQNAKGLWRWRCTSADGNVVLNSAEVYPLRVQAVADAITHGFVEPAARIGSEDAREAQQVAATDRLLTLKLKYESAFSAYESRISALSQTASPADSDGLREDVAGALHTLERARREYREALLQTAVGDSSSGR